MGQRFDESLNHGEFWNSKIFFESSQMSTPIFGNSASSEPDTPYFKCIVAHSSDRSISSEVEGSLHTVPDMLKKLDSFVDSAETDDIKQLMQKAVTRTKALAAPLVGEGEAPVAAKVKITVTVRFKPLVIVITISW